MNNLDIFFNNEQSKFASKYFSYIGDILKSIDTLSVHRLIEILIDARNKDANIFVIGNGGSAATASHFANDINIGTQSYQNPFRVISLVDNLTIISALGNDFGYENIFSKQLALQSRPNDLLIGISASGNSPNLLNAFEYAISSNIFTVSLTGFDGGKLKDLANHNIHVPTKDKEYGPAEDAHMVIVGLIGSYLIRYVKSEENKY